MILLVTIVLAGIYTANAQRGRGGFQRPSVEDRVKRTTEKLAVLKLDKDQLAKAEVVFTDFYKARDEEMKSMWSGGGEKPDRQAMMDKMKKMNGDRDEKLKAIFSEDQFKKWKDEVEPSLRPQRPGGKGKDRDAPPPPPAK